MRRTLLLLIGSALCLNTLFALGASELDSYRNMVLVEGGIFRMGSPESEDWRESDETAHQVRITSFYISRYEVTQGEYERVTGSNPSHYRGKDIPVENVSWLEAVAFCNALSEKEGLEPVYRIEGDRVSWNRSARGYRLPTEAEWEYACRGGSTTPFSTGSYISADESNYFGTYPYTIEDHYWTQHELETKPGVYRERTVAVDSFEPNALGLYNMHGNVSELCFDFYGAYSGTSETDPSGPEAGYMRVSRGGGWNDFAKHLRSAYRSAVPPDDRLPARGFRLVRNSR